jgi:RNA polymerase sigma factor (sigma-70 family)
LGKHTKHDIDSLYNEYVDDLYRYAQYLGFEHHSVMDAIHDIFCKICVNDRILDEIANIKLYLFRSLKNRLIDIYKSRKEYVGLDTGQIINSLPFTLNVTIEDELINKEEQEKTEKKINDILDILTARQREIIYFRFAQGYDYTEISNLMNITVPACHKLMYKTLNKIRKTKNLPFFILLLAFMK